jgi:hypothetical protein
MVEVIHVIASKITLEGSKHRAYRHIQGLHFFPVDIQKKLRRMKSASTFIRFGTNQIASMRS